MDENKVVTRTGDSIETQLKELSILVTDKDKYDNDITSMSDFFGLYIEQLSTELCTKASTEFIEDIPIADLQIINEFVHGAEVVFKGKYGYLPDFDSLPNDIKSKIKKGTYTLGESKQVEGNVRAVVLDEEGVRVKDVTLKKVLNTPDTMEMSRSIASQVQMRQISAKLDDIQETLNYLVDMERNNNIYQPFLNARDFVLRAQNAGTIEERSKMLHEASKELIAAINALSCDMETSVKHLAKLTRFPIFRGMGRINRYMEYIAQDLQLFTKYVGIQMHVLDYLGEHESSMELLEKYQRGMTDFADRAVNAKNQSAALLMHMYYSYDNDNCDFWYKLKKDIDENIRSGRLLQEREMYVVSIEDIKDE